MEAPTIILAIVSMDKDRIKGGGVPAFIVEDEIALQEQSFILENILDASAHEIDAHTMILVAH